MVLVGPAGAGKTTFAARHFAPDEVLSSDAYRALLAGDPTDQRATAPAFAALHRALRHRLSRRLLTVVDATSAGPHDRRPLLAAAAAAGVVAVAIVLDLPEETVLARNRSRGELAVPEAAVRRHLARVAASLREPGLAAEGFTTVIVVREPAAVEALRVVRVVSAGDGSPASRVAAEQAGRVTPPLARGRADPDQHDGEDREHDPGEVAPCDALMQERQR